MTAHAEPRWFKGNLHTHSLWSDGNDYPEMIVDWYARHGYQFLALSDHNVLSQGQRWMSVKEANKRARQDGFARYRKRFGDAWVETRTEDGDLQVRLKPLGEFRHLFERPGRFLLIQGEEITDRFETKPIHMNASNVLELIKPQGGKSVVEVMANNLAAVEEQARRLGRPILGHLNHPNFGYAITAEELAMVTKERFFEVYNGHPDVHHLGDETHAGVERMWDIINTLRIGEMKAAPVYGLATDDSHNYFGTGRLVAGPGLGHGPGPVPDPGVGHQGDRGGGLLRLQRRDAEGRPLLPRVEDAGAGDRAAGGRPVHDPVHRDAQGLRPDPEAGRRTRTASRCR